jgi:hypothetical protein
VITFSIKLRKLFLGNLAFFLIAHAFKTYITVVFEYQGYVWNFSASRLLVSLSCLNIMLWLLPSTLRKVSDFLLNYHFIFPILPLLALFAFQGFDYRLLIAVNLCFLVVLLFARLKPKPIKIKPFEKNQFLNILHILSFTVIISIILLGGYKYFNLDISKVYFFRSDASSNLPFFYGYINPCISKVVIPVSLVLSLQQRKYWSVLLSVIGCVLMFGLTAHKSILMYPVFIIVVYKVLRMSKNLNSILLFYSLTIYSIITYATISPIGKTLSSLFIRRVFILPAHITTLYYDFYATNEKVFYSLSKITLGLIDYQLTLKPGRLISEVYFGRPEMNSNTGWLGSGFMQMGYSGMFIYALLLGLFFYIIDCLSIGKDIRLISAGIVGIFMSVFQSVDLLTALFTHGLVLVIIIIAYIPKHQVTQRLKV